MIIKYVRKKDKTPFACLVAVKINGKVKIGWSMFNAKKETNSFNKDKAKSLALSRAKTSTLFMEHIEYNPKWKENSSTVVLNFPSSLKTEMDAFIGRAEHYFAVEEISNYNYKKIHEKKIVYTCDLDLGLVEKQLFSILKRR